MLTTTVTSSASLRLAASASFAVGSSATKTTSQCEGAAMIEMGLIVALGLSVTFFKLSWRNRLRMLSHPVLMDVAVFALLTMLHWGTFSGVMVATIGALVCSMMLSALRWAFGYMERGKHVPGRFTIRNL